MGFDEYIALLDELSSSDKPIAQHDMELYLDYLETISEQTGFKDHEIREIFTKLLYSNINPKCFITTIQYLNPATTVSRETIKSVFQWIHSNFFVGNKMRLVKSVLQWIIALLLFNTIQKSHLKPYYYLIVAKLNCLELQNETAHLIYMISDYDVVGEWTVNFTQKLMETNGKSKELKALLSLIRRIKPHLISSNVTIINNENHHFKPLPKQLVASFKITATRSGNTKDYLADKFLEWERQLIAFELQRPNLCITRYMTEMNSEDTLKFFLQADISKSITKPSAFLITKMGHLYLAVSPKSFKADVAKYIHKTLVIDGKRSKVSLVTFNIHLEKIAQLQHFFMEAVPYVSGFLETFIKSWDGILYKDKIFDLLEHYIIHNFDTFFGCILFPIYKLCSRGNRRFQLESIFSLSQCILNNYKYLATEDCIFNDVQVLQTCRDSILIAENAVTHICKLFINLHPDSRILLHFIMDHYCSVALSQYHFASNEHKSFMPLGILQFVLTGSDIVLIDKLAYALNIYTNFDFDKKETLVHFNLLISEFANIFFTNIFSSVIFSEFSDHQYNHQAMMRSFNSFKMSFKINQNFAFVPFLAICGYPWVEDCYIAMKAATPHFKSINKLCIFIRQFKK